MWVGRLGTRLVWGLLVQQNGGVLECERANQIAEFKFSDITTRNDHVTASIEWAGSGKYRERLLEEKRQTCVVVRRQKV